MINIIFFQNCISPHQIPYIRECAKDIRINKCFLIVPRIDYQQRIDMGWDSRNLLRGTSIICKIAPSDEEISEILEINKKSYCLFSGIRADTDVFRWLKMSLKYDVKRYIITEPPLTYKKPLWMHYIRFFLRDYKYIKSINGIFGFGQDAVNYYKNISKKWKVFPFQYVTETNKRQSVGHLNGKLKLLYVGSLTHRKNVSIVLKALEDLNDIEFSIIGNGEEEHNLKDIVNRKCLPVTFLGKKQMSEIPSIMEGYDVLILPSLHDGWGAVVNEAMTLGLYIIVSNKCGAKALVKNHAQGLVFINNNCSDLHNKIVLCIEHKEKIRDGLNQRLKYSESIQGPAVARYFINCLLDICR